MSSQHPVILTLEGALALTLSALDNIPDQRIGDSTTREIANSARRMVTTAGEKKAETQLAPTR